MAEGGHARGADGAVTRSTKAASATGVLAAALVAVLVNIFAARHYRRVDFTTSKLYTLSPATVQTLHSLEQSVEVQVLLPSSDPLSASLNSLLAAYQAESRRLGVRQVDPDRHPAEFVAIQQKYGILAGKTEDGRVLTDASVIVASQDRHWFVTSSDMVDVSEAPEGHSRSKIEQALTGAIRAVCGGERLKVCSTTGHGEISFEDNGPQGMAELRDRLSKNNYDPVTVDSTRPDARESYKDCHVLLIAGPARPFSSRESDEIGTRMRAGMGGMFLLNPVLDPDGKKQLDTGLEGVTKLFGIGLSNDFVFELDNQYRLPRGMGEAFFAEIKSSPITEGMIGASSYGLRVMLLRSRSLTALAEGARPAEILATSAEAFGMTDFFSWVEQGGDPKKKVTDRGGPLAVGMASELPKPEGAKQAHGPRLVVIGSANIALNQNWQQASLRGNAVLMENIISWVGARPPILDIPAKQTPAASLHITESSLGEIMRYVLVYVPGAAMLLGLAVYLMRRGTKKVDSGKIPGP